MNKFVTFASDIRVSALLCSSMTVLLTACGGGAGEQGLSQAKQQTQTAGYIVSNETTAAATAAADALMAIRADGDQAKPAALAPQETGADAANSSASTYTEKDFALTGYGAGDAMPAGTSATAYGASDAAAVAAATAAQASAPGAAARVAPVIPSTTYQFYVAPNGNDSNAGTAAAPFKTLARAARASKASTTVFVAPGTYPGGIKTTASGSAGGRIYFVSTTKWGAKIVAAGSSGESGWDNRGSYVDIVGFQVDGSGGKWTGGIYNGGSYDMIRANYVHHIAKGVACTSAGGSAIGVDSYYNGVKSDVIGNLVHDIGPAGCTFVQGIYVSTSGSVKNNVVYRVAEAAIHLWHDANHVIIVNNTVTTSNTGIIVGGGDFYHTKGRNDYTLVYSNIVYDNKMGVSEQGKTGMNNVYRNNLVFQNATYNWRLKNGLQHSGTVSSDPLFVSYTRTGTPDLRLSSSSPAIGRGTPTEALDYDFLENPRNADTGFDIGAYQH
ncbi:DUF1565 domain-containing protein [Massilia antarctica]|uniref:DUF1565 domain-containing protein n=1 Tax=Massilia antarctica TaxID=2765360 RepID=UPI0006BD1966|nr:DUF1565 domain-containing protein [Massilia sp. H27-R4]MCY0910491.1 DUF1565 domain-containing protein [Massilia sp. H27-R4]CUI09154.1 putative RTX toxin hemolysin-type calcium-binding protein [Janthinobacterium sp. CG23_2]CUU32940.1 putative RTX toxin hemolysin-type calcium-binding protein [Janthinobacterium sp. CG23_2]